MDALWSQWNNTKGQISFLRELVASPVKLLEREWASSRHIFSQDQFSLSSPEVRSHASPELEASVWNCLPLVETVMTLATLAENEAHDGIELILNYGLKSYTELLFLGLVQMRAPWGQLHQDVVSKLLHVYLTGAGTNSRFVQTRLWQVNQGLFMSGLLDLYHHDRSSLSRILKITEDLSILDKVLEVKSFAFAIDLAVLAYIGQLISLEKWLQNRIAAGQDIFARAVLDFLSVHITADVGDHVPSYKKLPLETIVVLLKVLNERYIKDKFIIQL